MNFDLTSLERARQSVTRIPHYLDAKRWNELRGLYTEEVETDYRSLGGLAQKETGDALIARWRASLEKVATQHLLGPIDVEFVGAVARADCHVRASHFAPGLPGGELWVVAGHYEVGLIFHSDCWLIQSMRLQTYHQEGNLRLLAEVAQ